MPGGHLGLPNGQGATHVGQPSGAPRHHLMTIFANKISYFPKPSIPFFAIFFIATGFCFVEIQSEGLFGHPAGGGIDQK